MNFSRFSAFLAITGSAARKNSLQMRRFQRISEFSHSLDPKPSLTPGPVKHLRQNPWLEVVPIAIVARVESSPAIVVRSRPERPFAGSARRRAVTGIAYLGEPRGGRRPANDLDKLLLRVPEPPRRRDPTADPLHAGRTRRRCSGDMAMIANGHFRQPPAILILHRGRVKASRPSEGKAPYLTDWNLSSHRS